MVKPKNRASDERTEQRARIAAWLVEVMREKHLKPTPWSKGAGLSPSTISRALNDDYTNILSATTLAHLARYAGVPIPFNDATSSIAPSAPAIAEILKVIVARLVPGRIFSCEDLAPYAQAFRTVLLELIDDPEAGNVPTLADRLARMALRQSLGSD